MHNTIIQLSKTPIEKDNYITEEDYYESWFLGGVADYVTTMDDEERDDAVGVLHVIDGFTSCDDGGFIIDKTKLINHQYDQLCDMFKKTLEQDKNKVVEDLDAILYKVQEIISDKFGVYIDYDGVLYTAQSFIRHNHGQKFYVGGAVDYHV